MPIAVRIHDSSGRIAMPEVFDFKVHRDFKSAYMPLLDNAAVREAMYQAKEGGRDSIRFYAAKD